MLVKDILFKNMLKAETNDLYVGYRINAPFSYSVYTVDEDTKLYSVWNIIGKKVTLVASGLTKVKTLFLLNIIKYHEKEEGLYD